MKSGWILVAAATLSLAACGNNAERTSAGARDNASCALIDATALFGAGALRFGYPGLDAFAGSCEFSSADGKRGGDIILYTPQSLHSVTAEARMQTVTAAWAHQTESPLAAIEGVGDAAQIATDLPGYQTQIAFRKGGSLVLISARSGDDAVTGEQLARRIAAAAANSLVAAH